VEAELFRAATGLPLEVIAAPLTRARRDGLLIDDSRRLAASEFGQRFLDDLVARFLPDGA
jgi:oxygen-independent coproporphyrinogen-3 oxidase